MTDHLKYLYLYYSRFDTVVLLDELCSIYYRWLSNRDYQDLGDRINCIRRIIIQRTKLIPQVNTDENNNSVKE